ncbi:MAG: methyltransferase domain-containing protein [Polyangiales bacterium]
MPLLDPLLPLAPVLDPVLDPLTIRATRAIKRVLVGPPFRDAQNESRERALADVLSRARPKFEAIADRVRRHDPEAIASYDALVKSALGELRGDAESRAASTGLQRVAHAVDRALHAEREEWLDEPRFDRRLRMRTIERLDRLNEAIGSYEAFFQVIEPLIERARAAGVARPTIVDLASGHAMFAVALALRFGAREGRVRIIATDLRDEYLDVGRAYAKKLALDVELFEQDALDLRDLPQKAGGPVDVVTCTQTLHHFPPGMIGRLFAGALSVARHGVALIDGERNPFAFALIATVSAALGRGSVPFFHDAIVSMRRMFTEQELAFCAEVAPFSNDEGERSVERGWLPPGHVWVRGIRGTARSGASAG